VVAVQAWLDQVQAHWQEQLGSFKNHVEKQADKHVEKQVDTHIEKYVEEEETS
jgi:hypothetical protein